LNSWQLVGRFYMQELYSDNNINHFTFQYQVNRGTSRNIRAAEKVNHPMKTHHCDCTSTIGPGKLMRLATIRLLSMGILSILSIVFSYADTIEMIRSGRDAYIEHFRIHGEFQTDKARELERQLIITIDLSQ
jgi:hypothetical protein